MEGPAASVVVATYGRAARLLRLLGALERQESSFPFEVVVVDDGSHDDTWEVLDRLAASSCVPVRPLRHDRNRGAAAARNTGWRASTAPIVAFTDDDCAPTPGWLAALTAALDGADVAEGMTVPDPGQHDLVGPFSRSLKETNGGFFATANVAYRRDVLARVGGFDEGFTACEDTDLALRVLEAGGRAAWVPGALVHHDVHPSDFGAYLREKRRWQGVPRVVGRHPQLRSKLHSRWFWRASHPPALAAAAGLVTSLAGGARRSPVLVLAGAALVLPYARFRVWRAPLQAGPRRRLALIPMVLAGDLYEVGVLAAGSVRHRTLVL